MNDCTKFGALDRSVTIWPKIGHKLPDYWNIVTSMHTLSHMFHAPLNSVISPTLI